MSTETLVERLRKRARTWNGTPVGAGDGNTYIPGIYGRAEVLLDLEVADALEAALRAALEAQPVAWRELDNGKWIYHDAGSDVGMHIAEHQKDSHGVYVFPVYATPISPAPVSVGERPEDTAEQFIQAAIDNAPEPLRRLGEWLANVLDEDLWPTAERMLLAVASPPAQEPPADQLHPSHVTRASDASTYDEVCTRCGATDVTGGGWGKLAEPCSAAQEPTHRHKKRGSEYVLLGIGRMQAQDWHEHGWNDVYQTVSEKGSVDMREVAIYRSVDDSKLWVRPREEFEDGRFEEIARPAQEPPGASDGWIEWSGGECLLLPDNFVEVRLRNGQHDIDYSEQFNWNWRTILGPYDVVAYRLSQPSQGSGR
jgi:hypothetical protein